MRARSTRRAQSTADPTLRLERGLARLASGQHGVVARRQLLRLGFGSGAIAARLRSGRLSRVHSGVYLVGHVARARLATEMAAVLACGTGAAISHASAARMWGIGKANAPRVPVHVTVASDWAPARAGIAVHRCRSLGPVDLRRLDGVPLTSPARTIIDLAASSRASELERAVAAALRLHGVGAEQLAEQARRHRGRPGVPRLTALLSSSPYPAFTRSRAERRLLALLRRSGCPDPDANQRIAGFEVDLVWREPRLVVEFDGYEYHSDRAAFERDRRRDAELQARGFRVIRVTWRQLVDAPDAVLGRIARTLAGPAGGGSCVRGG
jgi:very-short-patch-repair endonuclease/predicted transcriptional regulator of viral defense system